MTEKPLPRHFFYASLVFVVMITGIVAAITTMSEGDKSGDANTKYDLMANSDLTASKFNETFYPKGVVSNISSLQTKMKALSPDTEFSLTDVISLPVAFISTAWDMVMFIVITFGFMDQSIENMATYGQLPIPGWVGGLIIMFIVAFFVFSVLSLIFGKDF